MIQRKKKQLKIILLILLIIAMAVGVTLGIFNIVKNKDEGTSEIAQENLNEFNTKSLLIETTLSETEVKGKFQASQIEVLMNGDETDPTLYVLQYNTAEETKNAYEKLKNDESIKTVDINKDVVLKDEKNKILNEDMTLKNEINQVFQWVVGEEGTTLTSWGPYAMGLDKTQEELNAKEDAPEIVVAVIDSGIDLRNDVFKSETFKNRVLEPYDATGQSDATDNDGHGTNVAGIILESTPNNIKILPIKALEKDETTGETTGSIANIIAAINYAIEQNVDIINMSLGAEENVTIEKNAIDRAYRKGIINVVASGNGDKTGNGLNLDLPGKECYPAEYDNVITVGAVRNKLMTIDSSLALSSDLSELINNYDEYIKATADDMTIAQFSNYGSCIDFVAPGVVILGLTKGEGAPLASFDGTSQAAPHITAAVATIKTYNKDYTNEQVEEILKYYAKDLGDEGKDIVYGNGFVSFKDFEECNCGSDACNGIYCFGCDDEDCIFHKGSTNILTSIEITKEPDKLEYNEGERFDTTGMIVTAKYSDNTSKLIEDYTCTPMEITSELYERYAKDEYKLDVTISYTEGEVTKTAVQEIKLISNDNQETEETTKLQEIKITTPPAKTNYEVGDTFDKSGMVVTAIYSDGSEKLVGQYKITPERTLTINDTKVIISYAEGGIEKEVEQAITVKAKTNEIPETQPTDQPSTNDTTQNGQTQPEQTTNQQEVSQNTQITNDTTNNGPGLNSSMFEVRDEDGNEIKTGTTISGDRDESNQTTTEDENKQATTKKDETKSEEKLSDTGLEDSPIIIAISISVLGMVISYIAYKKYRYI